MNMLPQYRPNIGIVDPSLTMDETSKHSSKQDSNIASDDEDASESEESSEEEKAPKNAVPQVKDKKEAQEIFKEMLKEKNIHSTTSWEQASKLINRDPRFRVFEKNNERKQAFNAYKVQKQKEEKEESRQRQKKAKEELEKFFLNNDKMTSTTKYYKCEELFGTLEVWRSVQDGDRRDIYEDVIVVLAKREKEEAKELKKRNIKKMSDLLEKMPQITFQTTWSEAQQMLLENQTFCNDRELIGTCKLNLKYGCFPQLFICFGSSRIHSVST